MAQWLVNWLFFHKTRVPFSAPTWQLATVCSSSSRGSIQSLQAPDAVHLAYMLQNTHINNKNNSKKNFNKYRGIPIMFPFISKAKTLPEFPQQNFFNVLLVRTKLHGSLGLQKGWERSILASVVKTDKAKLVENE